jgi:uncharacterized membrane protein YdjX (TVP38/TMEM64 family)
MVIKYETQIALFNWQDWFLVTFLCCLTSTFAITPPTFLALIFSYFIGWQAFLPVFLMNISAIFLVNIITKSFNPAQLKSYLSDNQKVNGIFDNVRQQELKVIFFAKLSPIMPFSLSNFVFALSGAKLKNILLGGFLGMLPRTVLAISTGSQAKEIKRLLENPNEGNLEKIAIIILFILSMAGILYYVLPKKVSE